MFGLFEKVAAVSIERIGAERGEDCAALHASCFAYAWPQTDIEALLLASTTVAHGAIGARGALSGFVIARVAADEAEVLTVAVVPKRRDEGIARKLMAATTDALALSGARSLFLEVEADNAPALALYRRFAFETVGERKSYYRKPDGSTALAYIMRRPLP